MRLLLISVCASLASSSFVRGITGGKPTIQSQSHLSVYHVASDGTREAVGDSSEAHLKKVLCSAKVVSHLVPCGTPSAPASSEPPTFGTEPIYPMTEAYAEAVKAGHACPLPAPFMMVDPSTHSCCVPTGNKNIWPNFCDSINLIGSAAKDNGLKYEFSNELRINDHNPLRLPDDVFLVGVPDVAHTYSKYKAPMYVIIIYFVMGVVFAALYVYVLRWLSEEASIAKGKKREGEFNNARPVHVDSSSEESSSSSGSSVSSHGSHASRGSLSPAHDKFANKSPHDADKVAESMGSVSMSFGLLPGLPRGRSTANSAITTPLVSARGPPPSTAV